MRWTSLGGGAVGRRRLPTLCVAAVLLAACGGAEVPLPADEAGAAAGSGRQRALAFSPQQASLARWSAPISLPLVPASGALMADGSVLLWSGDSPLNFGVSGRTFTTRFDPATGALSPRIVSETGHEMFCPGTARLPDGRLLVNGGWDAVTTSLFDPATDSWTRAADMAVARGYQASVPLADGSVLTVGGSWSGAVGPKPAELFSPATGWRTLSGISTATPSLVTKDAAGLYRADNHMWLLPMGNGRVLHAGPSATMHWMDTTGNGSLVVAGPRADDTDSMNGNAVMFDAGKVLTLGGAVNYDGVAAKRAAFVIDATSGVPVVRRISPMTYPRVFANSTVLPNGQVVVIGGQTFGQPFTDNNAVLAAELFDPETERFTVLPAMTVPRNYHSIAMLLPDGRVLSAGGGLCGGCAGDHPDAEILSPPYLFNADGSAAQRPVITSAPALLHHGSRVQVDTDGAVTAFALVRLGATTHTVDNDQRRVALRFAAAGSNRYELEVPSNPGILLPGQWMLFALNAAGTPSLARIVTVDASGAPRLQNPGDLALTIGQPLDLALAVSSPGGSLLFAATGLPPGVVLDSATGRLSGVPTASGRFLAQVSVGNGSHTVSTDVLIEVSAIAAPGVGTGLLAQYFGNVRVSGMPLLLRVEAPDFGWGTAAPAAGVPADGFSVRWSGWLEPTQTGATLLRTLSDEGVRVWVDHRLVIDNWTSHAATATDSTTLNLTVGQRVPVVVEYHDVSGTAELRLQWQPPGQSTPVAVPLQRLYPAAAPSLTNLALGKPATQTNQYTYGSADKAVDGLYDGIVTHTESLLANEWWQVDLGGQAQIDRVQLWNRMNCCSERLANFTVMVSATDPTGRSWDELLADPAVIKRRVGVTPILPTISIPVNAPGRWVRVQLDGRNYLSIAEAEVFGTLLPEGGLPPSLAALPNQQSALGVPLSLALSASNPGGGALSFSASGLPPGLALNADTGLISGTPGAAGRWTVSVVVRNVAGLSAGIGFNWDVQASLPEVSELPAPPAVAGIVSWNPVTLGGAGALYSWTFGDGSPASAPSSSAAISHRFDRPGVYTVTLTAIAADGRSTSWSFVQAIVAEGPRGASPRSGPLLVEPATAGRASRVWVLNPDNDSVSVFDASGSSRLAEVSVGLAPRSLARAADGRIWVVNRDAASISVISPVTLQVVQTVALPRASQPYAIVFSPADGSAFVTLEAAGRLLKLHGSSGATLQNVAVGDNPRHLALDAAGTQLLLSRFITPPLRDEHTAAVKFSSSSGVPLGAELLRLNPATLALLGSTVLGPSTRADAENQGRGIPNYLGAAAIAPDGLTAWVPSKLDNLQRGTLRDGQALNFQNTVRAVSSRIHLATGAEDGAARVDHDNASVASAAAFHPSGAYLFVALETSRQVAVLDAAGARELFRFEVGLAPQGLAVSEDGLRLHVHNFMGRSLSTIDLVPLLQRGQVGAADTVTRPTINAEKLLSAAVLRGKQLFYDARDPRLARDSYMSCASCHHDGSHDGRVWDFTGQGEGLRNTPPLRGRQGMGQGFLHWSANFDELQDFEGQIRSLAGGTGLMANADFNAGTRSQPLGTAKAGLSADLDALAAYVASLGAAAPSPLRTPTGALTAEALAGRAVFASRNCASCHGGAGFTLSAGASQLKNIGTIKPSSGKRLGSTLSGIDIPTLRDVWATAPYLHDGSAPTLAAAVQAHSGNTVPAQELAPLVAYLQQIGGEEPAASGNLAQGRSASQSSTSNSGSASRAVDGNTNGTYSAGSVTHTRTSSQPWWQVDLGANRSIDSVQLWNRSDCCSARLSNFYVFVSTSSMSSRSLSQLLADSRVQRVQVSSLNGSISTNLLFGGVSGRYVKVQLAGTEALSLAEVQVLGR